MAFAAIPAIARAQTVPPPVVTASPYVAFVTQAARRFGIPEAWIWAVMHIESHGHARATSPKGAMGLMQIMPDTWAGLRARYGLGSDPYDPRDNILAGSAYLREMHDRYGAPGFLAAYNAGPNRYDDYVADGRPLPAETVAYVTAMAPLIGADPLPGSTAIAIADPLAWTRAPLFIAQLERIARANPMQADAHLNGAPAAPSAQDFAADPPRSDGLFVGRSDAARPK
ncbi:lytic transglycosylase domain-containing protein [Acidiphilium iwatense]|nr:lytic transglycosylase domain-containing protein [Acidiphilium iwatense]